MNSKAAAEPFLDKFIKYSPDFDLYDKNAVGDCSNAQSYVLLVCLNIPHLGELRLILVKV